MAQYYTKLFTTILDSTIWQEDLPTKVVWITMLAMADRDGVVSASVPGLMKRAGVTLEQTEAALVKFVGPDLYSRTQDHEGRRIEEIEGGWRLLNHGKYRAMMSAEDKREYQRVKQAEYRGKKKQRVNANAPLPGERAFVEAEKRGDYAGAAAIVGAGLLAGVSISEPSAEELKMDITPVTVEVIHLGSPLPEAQPGPGKSGGDLPSGASNRGCGLIESGRWVDGEWVSD